jgi:hypothetical protein
MKISMLFAKSIHMCVDNGRPTKKTHGYFFRWLEMYSNGYKLEVEISTSRNKKTKIQKEMKEYDTFNLGLILKKVSPK